ncbi:MAG: sulfatase-like hydrolase/transferase, partial [Flavobacteriaceae bacterium]
GQVGDFTTYFKGDRSYFDPVLWHNDRQEAYQGYCSDIFTEKAMEFIEKNKESPFFCYLAFNAPHTPLQVPESYYEPYKDIDPASGFEDDGRPFVTMGEKDKEDARKVYAMVTNIDDNLGKLFEKLEKLKIAENTLVIFMTDNGPQQIRYVGGMRGRKGSVYQGGVRVPFYLSYPAFLQKDRDIETMAAHVDILPTLAELCHVALPKERVIDGKSLVPLLKGEKVDWANRGLFFYWSRRYPELYHNMAIHKSGHKLVGNTAYNASIEDFELYDLNQDPYEQINRVLGNREMANNLKQEMDRLYDELMGSENLLDPPRISMGNKNENPMFLNRNDADGQRGIWDQEEIYGKWRVQIAEGLYNIRFKFIKPVPANGQMYLETNTLVKQMVNKKEETDIIEMNNVSLPAMDCDLVPFYAIGSKNIFPFWVEVEKMD